MRATGGRALRPAPAVAAGLMLALLGCSRLPPPNLYVLTPQAGQESRTGPAVAVVRVQLPDYLDRRQIVSREGPNGLKLSDDDRWGEPLRDNVQRVLAEDLSHALGNARVVTPEEGRGKGVKYEVLVTLDAFEPDGPQVVMRGHWQLRDLRRGTTLTEEAIDRQRPATADGYAALVAAMNRNLNEAGAEIAEATEAKINR